MPPAASRPKPATSRRRGPASPKLPASPAALATATLPDHDLDDEAELGGLLFAGLDFSERDVALIDIDTCRFVDTNMCSTNLSRARFSDCVLDSCDLANLDTESSSLVRVLVQGSRATGFRWGNGTLRDVVFSKCKLDLSAFHASKFERVRFEECNLAQSDFMDADLSGAEFVGCDLRSARFSQANMAGAVLTRCVLDGIEGVTSLRGAVIDPTDLLSLSYALARALGIVIAADDTEEAR